MSTSRIINMDVHYTDGMIKNIDLHTNNLSVRMNGVFQGFLDPVVSGVEKVTNIHPGFKDTDYKIHLIDETTIELIYGAHAIKIKNPLNLRKFTYSLFSYGKKIGDLKKDTIGKNYLIYKVISPACRMLLLNKYNLQ